MAAPFYNAIKGTTAGTPGTGAFTPNAASTGFLAWSTVPAGTWGLVRYEDGSAWELQFSYWNGTTLTRGTNQFVASSTGSPLTLTPAATAAFVVDGAKLQPALGTDWTGWWLPQAGSAGLGNVMALGTPTAQGTAAGVAVASTNFLTEQVRVQLTSATTAQALAGLVWSAGNAVAISRSTATRGGWVFSHTFGCAVLPTGPKFHAGMIGSTAGQLTAVSAEPSSLVANYACVSKDSTDTNLQFLCNSGVGGGTKIDTGMAMAANDWFSILMWNDPGALQIGLLLVKENTGAIYYGTTSTDVPVDGTVMLPNVQASLSATTGTALVLHCGPLAVRTGG